MRQGGPAHVEVVPAEASETLTPTDPASDVVSTAETLHSVTASQPGTVGSMAVSVEVSERRLGFDSWHPLASQMARIPARTRAVVMGSS